MCRSLSAKDKLDVPKVRTELRKDRPVKKHIARCLYRPFDVRELFYHDEVIERSRRDVMRHMLAGENFSIITTRQTRDEWHVFASHFIVGHKSVATYDINTLFPLYIFTGRDSPIKEAMFQDWPKSENGRVPNLDHKFVDEFSEKLGLKFVTDGMGDLKKTFGPEDILHYIYAIFHSPTYRSRYAEFLKIDFPRVPLTSDKKLFRKFCDLGNKLISLHLMDTHAKVTTKYPVEGDDAVEKVRYVQPEANSTRGQVWINKKQYFDGVPQEVWEFQVGGYQVCEKWLKDRKGRELSYDELTHYQYIVSAIAETLRIMKQIDGEVPRWPVS